MQKSDAGKTQGDREPRTPRGQRTRRALLDAAALEFGEKGFHDGSISSITRRAGVSLGTFYTYFAAKDEIFRALVRDMSARVGQHAGEAVALADGAVAAEGAALAAFLAFAREHKEVYRIIDEAEFTDRESYLRHYEGTAARILDRLRAGAERGEIREDIDEIHAWAIMGMNVFLGLRYCVLDDRVDSEHVARIANKLVADGIRKR
ncbi:MAG: TetR/AcrR family transcriptional regulator [Sphingomonadaceae bacterium]